MQCNLTNWQVRQILKMSNGPAVPFFSNRLHYSVPSRCGVIKSNASRSHYVAGRTMWESNWHGILETFMRRTRNPS